jgi:predicted aldo/keto reductase-like oxidoreductase
MGMDHSNSRRRFLATGVAGIAGAALFPSCSGGRSPDGKSAASGPIAYRTLGRTGLRLPVVSMGADYGAILARRALEEGLVYIHTSSSYSEGNSERMLGRAFRGLARDSFVIATSPDLPYQYDRRIDRTLDLGKAADAGRIATSLEGSLQRLGLEYVDIYYLTSVGARETALYEPYLKAYEKLKREGKTRFVGIGTHSNEPEIIRAATASGLWDVVLTAFNFRQSHREEIRLAIGEAARAGLGIVAMKTQAGVYWSGTRTKINMKAALKWVLQDENVHTTIPAFSNYEEMREDMSIMESLPLTPEERRDLRLVETQGRTTYFCQQCASCLPQCSAGLEIPRLMRASMYARGHGHPDKAIATLRGWSAADITCTRCDRCSVCCTLGLDVKSRALDMAHLLRSRMSEEG